MYLSSGIILRMMNESVNQDQSNFVGYIMKELDGTGNKS